MGPVDAAEGVAPDGRRVLFTTPYRIKDPRLYGDTYDYPRFYQRRLLHTSGRRGGAAGLRFLRHNLPFIRILEFPTWSEWMAALRSEKWDVIGFSLYINEVPEVFEMVRTARETHPDAELWAGNYGALTPGVAEAMDRVFVGYAEPEVAREFSVPLKEANHPPLVGFTGFAGGFKVLPTGVLYVTRGCAVGCTFCHTTLFQPKPETVSLESVRQVVEYYRALGIRKVIILDEFFGAVPRQAEAVIDILHENGMKWRPQTRPNFLYKHLDDWAARGMCGCFIGLESFDDGVLKHWGKGYKAANQNLDLLRRLQEKSMAITGYYIIGHETQDRERIKAELKYLANLRIDTVQINIITPLPGTESARDIENRFGIFDNNWHHYDGHHLVWNHPRVGPAEMRALLDYGLRISHPNTGVVRTWLKSLRAFGGSYARGLEFYLQGALRANLISYHEVNSLAGPLNRLSEIRNVWFSRREPLWFRDFFADGASTPAGWKAAGPGPREPFQAHPGPSEEEGESREELAGVPGGPGSHSTLSAEYLAKTSRFSLAKRPGM